MGYHVFTIFKDKENKFKQWIGKINEIINRKKLQITPVPFDQSIDEIQDIVHQCAEKATAKAACEEPCALPDLITATQLKKKVKDTIYRAQTQEWLERDPACDPHYSHRCARIFLNADNMTQLTRKKQFHGVWTRFITGHSGIFEAWKETRKGNNRMPSAKRPNYRCWCGEEDTPVHQIVHCKLHERVKYRDDFMKATRKTTFSELDIPNFFKEKNCEFFEFLKQLITQNIQNSNDPKMRERAKKQERIEAERKWRKTLEGERKQEYKDRKKLRDEKSKAKKRVESIAAKTNTALTEKEKQERIEQEVTKMAERRAVRKQRIRIDQGPPVDEKAAAERKKRETNKRRNTRVKIRNQLKKSGEKITDEEFERRVEKEVEEWIEKEWGKEEKTEKKKKPTAYQQRYNAKRRVMREVTKSGKKLTPEELERRIEEEIQKSKEKDEQKEEERSAEEAEASAKAIKQKRVKKKPP